MTKLQISATNIAIAAILASLFLPAGASAAQLSRAQVVRASLHVADDFYGQTGSCASRVLFVGDEPLTLATGEHGALGSSSLGGAWTNDCKIMVAADVFDDLDYDTRVDLCRVIVHERGHALGREHDAELRSIMNPAWEPGTGDVVYGCYRRLVPRGRRADFRAWRAPLRWQRRPR